jgi:hypothetical protein
MMTAISVSDEVEQRVITVIFMASAMAQVESGKVKCIAQSRPTSHLIVAQLVCPGNIASHNVCFRHRN